MPETVTQVPLTEEEKDHLALIYNSRRRFFFSGFGGVIIIALVCCFKIYGREDMEFLGGVLFLFTPLCIVGFNLYRKKVFAYRKDLENGVKEMLPYAITKKSYFEHTGQYFFSFDDPNYMHHEVDAEMYHQCCEGDVLYIARAPRSKYVFVMDGRFSIM